MKPKQKPAQSMTATETASAPKVRSLALDALRGLAIIGMIFSGLLPTSLPAWMFHARTPPPTGAFDKTIMGITWVDLVLPFFVFALGAAIPFSMSGRLQKGLSNLGALRTIAMRFVLLAFFAIFLPQIGSAGFSGIESVYAKNLIVLGGFGCMFAFFARFPTTNILSKHQTLINGAGFALLVALLAFKGFFGNPAFAPGKNNIILLILANTYLVTALLWLFTRSSLMYRVLFLVAFTAFRFSLEHSGDWVKVWSDWVMGGGKSMPLLGPASNYFNYTFMQFAHIAILGSIVGEFVMAWLKTAEERVASWSRERLGLCALYFLSYNVVLCAGLFMRRDAAVFAICLCSILPLYFLIRNPKTALEIFLNRTTSLGLFLILTGRLFGPANDGIHKDSPSTIGYLYCTAGLGCMTIAGFALLVDVFKVRRGFGLIVANGQNPMIAYVFMAHCLWPVLGLFSCGNFTLMKWMSETLNHLLGNMAGGTAWALIQTLAVMICVAFFTRRKIFWRT